MKYINTFYNIGDYEMNSNKAGEELTSKAVDKIVDDVIKHLSKKVNINVSFNANKAIRDMLRAFGLLPSWINIVAYTFAGVCVGSAVTGLGMLIGMLIK